MLISFAVWVPLALPVQEPKADPPKPAAAWTPKDKETVVLLGSAFIEQEARDGYLETELIRLFPNKDIRVRNLGWSGDTVHCQARSYFGPPEEGFERLRGHLQMIKPTTVICCYGANESWKGEPGIPDFRKGYEKLIDMIREATGATVVLMTPPPFGKSIPKSANESLSRYRYEIASLADARRLPTIGRSIDRLSDTVVRAFDRFQPPLTEGPLLTADGYRFIAEFYLPTRTDAVHSMKVNRSSRSVDLKGFALDEPPVFEPTKISWKATEHSLRSFPQELVTGNENLPNVSTTLLQVFTDIPFDASWRLFVDGVLVGNEPANGPKECVTFLESDARLASQTEQLRQAIVKKNALFFHRWRPANETYLYGFRKHEQGNNGVEPPMFDKLVEQAEAEIAKLKKPVPHKYELIRVEEKDKK